MIHGWMVRGKRSMGWHQWRWPTWGSSAWWGTIRPASIGPLHLSVGSHRFGSSFDLSPVSGSNVNGLIVVLLLLHNTVEVVSVMVVFVLVTWRRSSRAYKYRTRGPNSCMSTSTSFASCGNKIPGTSESSCCNGGDGKVFLLHYKEKIKETYINTNTNSVLVVHVIKTRAPGNRE